MRMPVGLCRWDGWDASHYHGEQCDPQQRRLRCDSGETRKWRTSVSCWQDWRWAAALVCSLAEEGFDEGFVCRRHCCTHGWWQAAEGCYRSTLHIVLRNPHQQQLGICSDRVSRIQQRRRGRGLRLRQEVAAQASAEPKQGGVLQPTRPGSDGAPDLRFCSGESVQTERQGGLWHFFLLTEIRHCSGAVNSHFLSLWAAVTFDSLVFSSVVKQAGMSRWNYIFWLMEDRKCCSSVVKQCSDLF